MNLKNLAKSGVLRAAINTGNRALVQKEGDVLSGVSPALARRLAGEMGVDLDPVIYDGAGKVFADAENDQWDVAFLAIDEKRAHKISYTCPYITIEATYAVRLRSGLKEVNDVDQEGASVLTALGSAYDMHLTKTLKCAKLERFGTPPESFAAFREGRCDAVAGVRESLTNFFHDDPEVQVLPGILTSVRQAMAMPNPDNPMISVLDNFVRKMIEEGFVANARIN